ncbi:MAG TPA: hypothetical protein PK239_18750, partial [Chitinophagales bacterium]|nr:hypothetical protein [Chitinophagales bacterium]HRK29323.1 hypothetical protein [Chitinophagales bacterium]
MKKNIIYLFLQLFVGISYLSHLGAQPLRFSTCTDCSNAITNNYNQSMTGTEYGAIFPMTAGHVTSDYGRRGSNSRWHMGVDFSTQGGNDDAGDHIYPIETGTITAILNLGFTNHYKVVVIEGEHIFGYGHLFFDEEGDFPSEGVQWGNILMKKLNPPDQNSYAIIYNPAGGTPVAFSNVNGGTVTHPDVNGGLPLTTTNQVTNLDIPIGAMGNSGGDFQVHLHLYSLTTNVPDGNDVFLQYYSATNQMRRTKDPLQYVTHAEPEYLVDLDFQNINYSPTTFSSIKVRCAMADAVSGSSYANAVVNIDEVALYIKEKAATTSAYQLIKGAWLESKIVHGARIGVDRYPSPGFPAHNGTPTAATNFPFNGVDIAHPDDNIGKGSTTRTGIFPYAYSNYPYDDFYFSDLKLRIHKDDDYSDTEIRYAHITEDARYPDNEYELYARLVTVTGEEYHSDFSASNPNTLVIDNFRPYIKEVSITLLGL